MTGALFKWFGSKYLASRSYPAPKYDSIIEPFAGGAGYSLRYAHKKVTLCERDPHILKLWIWLIHEATEDMIRDIPVNVPIGTDIRTLGLSEGQALLLKNWQRTNNVGNCWTVSSWGNLTGQWTERTRSRVASEVGEIKHWQILPEGLQLMQDPQEATWFIDPIYKFNFSYRQQKPDYLELGHLCQRLKGQVLVCEAPCRKTGQIPDWLPFAPVGEFQNSRRKTKSLELLFSKG